MRLDPPRPSSALTIAAVLFAAAWGAALALAHWQAAASPIDRAEAALLDMRFVLAGPRPAPDGLVIVAIDDDTVREAGRYPLPRMRLADLVAALHRAGARAVGLDLLFLDPGESSGDASLAAAMKTGRTVVAAAALFGDGAAKSLSEIPEAARVLWPLAPFRQAAGVGLVNIVTDHAGTPRHVPLLLRAEGVLVPGFALRLAAAAVGDDPRLDDARVGLGAAVTETDRGFHLPLRFFGPRGSLRTVSAGRVLRGEVDPALFRDRIVVVGANAVGTSDTFATPFDPVLPGVEVLATAVAHLLDGGGLKRTDPVRLADGAAAIALPAIAILLIASRRIAVGLALSGLLLGLWIAFVHLAFEHGLWFSMAMPIAAAFPPLVIYGAARLWLDQRTERRMASEQDRLRRFQPPALADRLTRSPDFLAEPVAQEAGILFIDLSGFTGLSERLGPGDTREVLKGFHSVVDEEVTRHGGLVLSFMGDGAMILFGLPQASREDATRAVAAALGLSSRVGAWLAGQPTAGAHAVRVRVGAHYGPVVVSRLGGDTYEHITATGDSVNVASRLLEVARQEHATIVFSADILAAAGPPLPSGLSPERQIGIRGRSHPIAIRTIAAAPI